MCLHGLGVARFRRDVGAASSALHLLRGAADQGRRARPDHPEIAALRRNIAVVRAGSVPERELDGERDQYQAGEPFDGHLDPWTGQPAV